MFSEGAPRPRSRHKPCWGLSRLVCSSPFSCRTRNGCFTGFFLTISPISLPPSFPLVRFPPALVGVTRWKGTLFSCSWLSNRPSTYPLGRSPNSLRGPCLWCLARCIPFLPSQYSRSANINKYITSCPSFEHDKYWKDDDIDILMTQHSNKSSAKILWAGACVWRLTGTVTGVEFICPLLNCFKCLVFLSWSRR